jgi:hypothetical protein
MKWLTGVLALSFSFCLAQVPVMVGGREGVVVNNSLFFRECGEHSFRLADGVQTFLSSQIHTNSEAVWDGFDIFRMGTSSDFDLEKMELRYGGQTLIEKGEFVKDKDRPGYWFWNTPYNVPGFEYIFGAWNRDVLVGLKKPLDAKDPSGEQKWALALLSLPSGAVTELLEVESMGDGQVSSAVIDGIAYVFTSKGLAVRVDISEKRARILTNSFWEDLGMTLCKRDLTMRNPRVFGKAFFDTDGSVLIPVCPFLVLEKEDVERGWERSSPERRADIIKHGYYPFDAKKGVGWKAWATFIRFRPDSNKFNFLEEDRYASLIVKKDIKFWIQEFKDFGAYYFTDGGNVIPFGEAALLEKVPEKMPLGEKRGGLKTGASNSIAPSSKGK